MYRTKRVISLNSTFIEPLTRIDRDESGKWFTKRDGGRVRRYVIERDNVALSELFENEFNDYFIKLNAKADLRPQWEHELEQWSFKVNNQGTKFWAVNLDKAKQILSQNQ